MKEKIKSKLKQYSHIPSHAHYAWAVYLYAWIFILIIILVVLSFFGTPIHLDPNITDVIMLVVVFGTLIFSIAACVQIAANIRCLKNSKHSLGFKRILINLILIIGILIFIYYSAGGD